MDEENNKVDSTIIRTMESQLILAKSMGLDNEIITFLQKIKEWKRREWYYLCGLDGMTISELEALESEKASIGFIRKCRIEHLKNTYMDRDMLAKEVEQIRNEMQAAEEKSRKLQDLIEKNLQSALVREAEAQQKLLEEKDKAIERLQMEKEELNARIAQDLKVLQEPAGNLHKNIQGKKRRFGTFFGKKKEEKILITILKNREMSDEQKDFLIDCLEEGMDTQEIASFASPDLSVAIMKRLKELRKKER